MPDNDLAELRWTQGTIAESETAVRIRDLRHTSAGLSVKAFNGADGRD